MRRSEAKIALEAARGWQQRGMFKDGAFPAIEKELAPSLTSPSLATQTMYVIGGVMLGAATAALYALLRVNDALSSHEETAWAYFAIWGLVLVLAGVVGHQYKQRELADTLLIAGLIPWAITLGPQSFNEILHLLPGIVGVAVMIWRRADRLIPTLGLALGYASMTSFLFRALEFDAFGVWFGVSVAAYVGMVAWHRQSKPSWSLEAEILASGLLVASMLSFVMDALEFSWDASVEVMFGIGLVLMIAAAVPLQLRATTAVATGALTIDAIVFAFDIGGPNVGLAVLLVLAVGLIAAATLLRRRGVRA